MPTNGRRTRLKFKVLKTGPRLWRSISTFSRFHLQCKQYSLSCRTLFKKLKNGKVVELFKNKKLKSVESLIDQKNDLFSVCHKFVCSCHFGEQVLIFFKFFTVFYSLAALKRDLLSNPRKYLPFVKTAPPMIIRGLISPLLNRVNKILFESY